MKRFLLSGFVFLFLMLAINAFFNALVWERYINDYDLVDLNSGTFVLADSHGLSLEDHMEANKIHNFSAASDSYFDMLRKVKFLIREGNLKKVIITVDDHTLSKYREGANNLDRSAVFASAAEFDSFVEFIKVRYIKRHIALFNPKSRNILREIFKARLRPAQAEVKRKAWSELSPAEQEKRAKGRAEEQFPDKHKSEKLIESLNELIAICKENNIELIGLKFPVSAPFHKHIEGKGYGADSLFRARGIRVIDNTTIYLNMPDDYFRDQDHLSDKGGQEFAKLLNTQIQNLNTVPNQSPPKD